MEGCNSIIGRVFSDIEIGGDDAKGQNDNVDDSDTDAESSESYWDRCVEGAEVQELFAVGAANGYGYVVGSEDEGGELQKDGRDDEAEQWSALRREYARLAKAEVRILKMKKHKVEEIVGGSKRSKNIQKM